jgi:hypothetical protein
MKTTKLFFMAALALMTAACSNDDNEFAQQPQKAEGITITAQLAPKTSGATTRAVSDDGTKIVAEWAANEHIAILYTVGSTKKVADATITGVDASGTATISFTVDGGTTNDTPCTLVYPYSAAKEDHSGVKDAITLLAVQDGTLSANLDVRVGAGTIQTTTPGLTVTTQPAAQFAIWKLTLNNSAKDLYITADGVLIAGAIRSSAGTEFYVAVPAVDSKTVAAVATDGSSNSWFFSKADVSLAAGKYYQSSPTMTAVGTLSSAAVYKVTDSSPIPAGKTAVLSGVTFSSKISCSGDATIILMGNNTLNGGLQASPSGKTMTITGTGSLDARSSGDNPGIGAFGDNNRGNIIICGGTITAQPDDYSSMAAGIGSGENGTCGNITICGGTVTATGGVYSAGIGSGQMACGTVTITDGATKVTATGGNSAENSIGKGHGSCGTVTIDGVVNATTSSTFEHFNSDVSGSTWTLTHK